MLKLSLLITAKILVIEFEKIMYKISNILVKCTSYIIGLKGINIISLSVRSVQLLFRLNTKVFMFSKVIFKVPLTKVIIKDN